MLYKFLYYLLWPIYKIFFFFTLKNKPKDLAEGKLIICSNHINLMDPFTLALGFRKNHIYFVSKKELFDNKFLAYFMNKLGAFPIDREGIDLKAVKKSVKVLNEDKYLGIFPEGTRVKEVKKENIKNGIGYIALKANADILPLEIVNGYRLFGRMRLDFKPVIKINDYKDLDKRQAYDKIAEDVYKSIYEIV